jgi:prepilin-type processing-associated H-X9-DG protein
MDTVVDGLSNTLMLSENVRAGYDPYAISGSGWASPFPRRNSFFVSGYVCENLSCSDGNVDYSRANSAGDPYRWEAINSSHDQPEGEAPWPSSYHPGGVNVMFADGHSLFLSENVEGSVYASLVSPQGMLLDGPLQQAILSDHQY